MCKCEKAALIWPLVLAILGGLILIASFVLPAVLLSSVSTAFYRESTINTPETNQNDYNHFISNNYADSSALYYSYYFFNCSNLPDVIQNNSMPELNEVGPYTYQEFYQYYYPVNGHPQNGVKWDSQISTATYAEVDQQIFQTGLHPIYHYQLSCSNCNDQTDIIYAPSPLYASLFFDATFAPASAAVTSEGDVRLALSALGLFGILSTVNTEYTAMKQPLFSSNFELAVHLLSNSSFQSPWNVLVNFYNLFYNPVYGLSSYDLYDVKNKSSLASVYKNSFEYWAVANTSAFLSLLLHLTGISQYDPQTMAINSTLAEQLYFSSVACPSSFGCPTTCPNLTLSSATGGGCWVAIALSSGLKNLTSILNDNGISINETQVAGVVTWLYYQADYFVSFLFDIEGNVGSSYQSISRGAFIYPTIFPSSSGYYHNANMFVGKSPYQLLFQNSSLLAALLLTGKEAFPQEIGLLGSTQRSPAADLSYPKLVVTVNTGQVNIDQVDQITAFSSGIPFSDGAPLVYQVIYGSPSYDTTGGELCNFALLGSPDNVSLTISQDYFNMPTHWTPTFPPGHTTSTYGWSNSIVSDGLMYTLFNSVLQRQSNFSIWFDTSVQGIDVHRFTLTNGSYTPDTTTGPGYGVLSYAVGLYMCSGTPAFTTPPRFQKVNLTVATAAFSELLSRYYNASGLTPIRVSFIVPILNYLSNNQLQETNPDADPNYLLAWQDLETVSGQFVRGSLKEQLNLVVFPWAGAVNASTGVQNTTYYMGPSSSTLWPVVWSDKHGELTTSEASSLKTAIGAVTASRLVLIIGTVIGGVQMIVSSVFVGLYYFRRRGYATQTSKIDLNTISV